LSTASMPSKISQAKTLECFGVPLPFHIYLGRKHENKDRLVSEWLCEVR
jgi:hypothetical protein